MVPSPKQTAVSLSAARFGERAVRLHLEEPARGEYLIWI